MAGITGFLRKLNISLSAVIAVAAGTRLLSWYALHGAPLTGDEAGYFAAAQTLIHQGETPVFWPPITGMAASVVLYFGGSLAATRFLWSFVGVINVYLLYVLLSRFLDRPVPILASALYAVYLPAISFSTFVTSETPAVFLFLMSANLALYPGRSIAVWRCVLVGLIGGLLVLTRPSLALLVPVIALLSSPTALSHNTRWGKPAAAFVILSLCAVVVTSWAIRNLSVHGNLFISTNTAYNFYLGNNPAYQEDLNLFDPRPTKEQVELRKRRLLGRGGAADEQSMNIEDQFSYALIYIEQDPLLFMRRALGRLARIFVPKTSTLQLAGGETKNPWFTLKSLAILLATNVPYGAMLFLGWAGIILSGRSAGEKGFKSLALATIAGSAALCMIAISKPRYSFPFDPFLGAGLCWLLYHGRELFSFATRRDVITIVGAWIFFAWSWTAWLIFAFYSRSAVYGSM